MSIAILAPGASGLTSDQSYLPALVQGEFVSNFSGYSAISVLDRLRLDDHYAELLSGYYDDNAEAGMDLGHLAPTDYIMGGSITKTAAGYALQIQIMRTSDKMTAASHSGTFSFTELDNLSGIRRASLDLLEKMGVTPTERTRTELSGAALANHVNAQVSLAQGITAQRQGTVVEALSRYIQSSNYDPSLTEAASRLNILSADVTSGNIGENVRNDLQWRDRWVARLKECEEFYTDYVKNPPPYSLVYSTNVKQGAIDYNKRTVSLSLEIAMYPDRVWLAALDQAVKTVRQGLLATKRADVWGLADWPKSQGITRVHPFGGRISGYTVEVEIFNSEGKSLGAKGKAALPAGIYSDSQDFAYPVSARMNMVFPEANPEIMDDIFRINIVSINGIPAEAAAKRMNISIMSDSEYSGNRGTTFTLFDFSGDNVPTSIWQLDSYRRISIGIIHHGVTSVPSDFRLSSRFLVIPDSVASIADNVFIYLMEDDLILWGVKMGANIRGTGFYGMARGAGDLYERNGRRAGFYLPLTVDEWVYFPDW